MVIALYGEIQFDMKLSFANYFFSFSPFFHNVFIYLLVIMTMILTFRSLCSSHIFSASGTDLARSPEVILVMTSLPQPF